MIGYIVVFVIIGISLGFYLKKEASYLFIGIITIAWAFVMGPWAVATLVELSLGHAIGQSMRSAS